MLAQKKLPPRIGRPTEFTGSKLDNVVKFPEDMVQKAAADYEVTLPMVMKRARVKVCEWTVLTSALLVC